MLPKLSNGQITCLDMREMAVIKVVDWVLEGAWEFVVMSCQACLCGN